MIVLNNFVKIILIFLIFINIVDQSSNLYNFSYLNHTFNSPFHIMILHLVNTDHI
ncbi:unnamed protein product [Arabidopsis halleri]